MLLPPLSIQTIGGPALKLFIHHCTQVIEHSLEGEEEGGVGEERVRCNVLQARILLGDQAKWSPIQEVRLLLYCYAGPGAHVTLCSLALLSDQCSFVVHAYYSTVHICYIKSFCMYRP